VEGARPYQDVAARLASQHEDGNVTIVEGGDPESIEGSVLVLGGPDSNPAATAAGRLCADKVTLQADGFTVHGQLYQGKDLALLVSCRHARQPASVLTWFYGTTTTAAQPVARLLFFYGWQSYLVFRDGAVIARGDFATIPKDVEVEVHAQ
jgi:aminopeptidase N